MTYLSADKAERRTAREEASARTRAALWAERLAAADTPKRKAQVWYDRLRGVVSGNFPAALEQELWQMVVDDLDALCARAQQRVDEYKARERAARRLLPSKTQRTTFW